MTARVISKSYRLPGQRKQQELASESWGSREITPHTEASLFHRRPVINYSNRSLFDGERENVSEGREKILQRIQTEI